MSSLVLFFHCFYSCETFFFAFPPFWFYMILAISVEFCFYILSNSIMPERKHFWDWVHTWPEMNYLQWAALSGPGSEVSFYSWNTTPKWSFWHLYLGVSHRSILQAAYFRKMNLSCFLKIIYISRFFSIFYRDQILVSNFTRNFF